MRLVKEERELLLKILLDVKRKKKKIYIYIYINF